MAQLAASCGLQEGLALGLTETIHVPPGGPLTSWAALPARHGQIATWCWSIFEGHDRRPVCRRCARSHVLQETKWEERSHLTGLAVHSPKHGGPSGLLPLPSPHPTPSSDTGTRGRPALRTAEEALHTQRPGALEAEGLTVETLLPSV